MEKICGTVAFWSPTKNFGFFITKSENNFVQKYFAHASRISVCECPLNGIKPGYFVRFRVNPEPPKKQGDVPYAIDVEIYLSEQSCAIADLAASASGTGVQQ